MDLDAENNQSMSELGSSVVVISDDEISLSAVTDGTSLLKNPSAKRKLEDDTIDLSDDSDIDIESTFEVTRNPKDTTIDLLESERGTVVQKVPYVKSPETKEGGVESSEDPLSEFDKTLPDTVTLLHTEWGSKVYVVGTVHFSQESQEDVSNIIRAVRPHYVVVELCQYRAHMLTWEEDQLLKEVQSMTAAKMRDTIRTNGVAQGLMYLMLLSVSAHLTKELGMAPGGEFRRAFREAQQIPNCILHLGDRAISITLKRALSSLTWWQSIKFAYHLLCNKDPISKEEVEKCKKRDILEAMVAELAGEYPQLKEVFVTERDQYLTYSLQNAAMLEQGPDGLKPCRVVGVVGIGHMQGIKDMWNKVDVSDIPPLLTVPPPSTSSKVLKLTFKLSLLAGVLYAVHRMAPVSAVKSYSNHFLEYFSFK